MTKGFIDYRCNKDGFVESKYNTENANCEYKDLREQTWWDGDEDISAEKIARDIWEGDPEFVDCKSIDHDTAVLALKFGDEPIEYSRYEVVDLDEVAREQSLGDSWDGIQ